MIIAVTGGAGFVGSHLVKSLLEEGHEVIAIDNFVTGTIKNFYFLPKDFKERFTLLEQDISEETVNIDFKLDRIYHLASPASPIDYANIPIETLKVGSIGTYNILNLAMKHKARFLMASTSEVYGDPLEHPQKETYWGNVNPIGPRSCYDEAKRFSEAMIMAYHRVHGLDMRIARIFNTYGPNMRLNDGRVVPAFISQALKGEPITVFGDGNQTRSFCYVSDLVRGLKSLMETPNIHEPVNLGNPAETTIKNFAEMLLTLTGSTSKIEYKPLPQDDPLRRRPDITKAVQLLNWHPEIPLSVGLTKTIEWAKQYV
ncbi:MAG: SDR family oxidoreductase [Candidatus Riflebacteria bacterium]|nr:SDR family oxidoreductase [Candidatus Riflebacteria bacterium]